MALCCQVEMMLPLPLHNFLASSFLEESILMLISQGLRATNSTIILTMQNISLKK
jgi:hypothetical protein